MGAVANPDTPEAVARARKLMRLVGSCVTVLYAVAVCGMLWFCGFSSSSFAFGIVDFFE
jgi:hypothetical protein